MTGVKDRAQRHDLTWVRVRAKVRATRNNVTGLTILYPFQAEDAPQLDMGRHSQPVEPLTCVGLCVTGVRDRAQRHNLTWVGVRAKVRATRNNVTEPLVSRHIKLRTLLSWIWEDTGCPLSHSRALESV